MVDQTFFFNPNLLWYYLKKQNIHLIDLQKPKIKK